VGETLPAASRSPMSLRLLLPGADTAPSSAEVQLRVRRVLADLAIAGGARAVEGFVVQAVGAFEALLERPEVAEFLPPVVD
jgi:hypothetical protein